LSARTLAEDRMLAFDAGTDQYLTKPFELAELLNRVRNVIERRRTKTAIEDSPKEQAQATEGKTEPLVYEFPHFTLDVKRYELNVGSETHSLTSRELELLKYFIEHEGEVLSRSRILEDVWDEPSDLTTRAIDNFVMRLRKYLEPDPANPRYILSVRGVGYRFVAQTEVVPCGPAEQKTAKEKAS
jgi:DNA-binding response OmpR family regulator